MTSRQYRPGSRNPKFRLDGRISDNRVVWLRTAIGQFVGMRYPFSKADVPDDVDVPEDPEIGPSYILLLPVQGRKPLKYNLTALTMEELKLTRQFFNLMFDLAEPIVEYRDKVAEDAAAQGDDSFARYYRQVPQYVERSRTLREDDQGILNGFANLPQGAGGGVDPDGGVRGDGDELAPGEPSEDRAQDYAAEADQS